jgi:hypothetical protein
MIGISKIVRYRRSSQKPAPLRTGDTKRTRLDACFENTTRTMGDLRTTASISSDIFRYCNHKLSLDAPEHKAAVFGTNRTGPVTANRCD